MDKTAIKNFAIEARKILMKSAITEAGFYGITKDGCKEPVQKGNDFEVYETVAGTENRIFGNDIKRRANLVQAINSLGFDQVIEETAYTWFNRIIAIRFMEVNNYLPTRVRVLSSETGSNIPDIITQSDTVELNLSADELNKIQTAKRENRYDDAFRMLFIKQCNELNMILPGLFEKTDDYMELLLKLTYTGDGVVRMLIDFIPEDNFNVEKEGQVEIIGWMYQYYNTELKDDTFAKLKKNVKITKERIPAATQLFTPDWIVRYMVENSLGRVWIEHLRAVNPFVDEKTKAEEFGWKYYLPEAKQEEDVQAQLIEARKSYKDLTPQDITCIDPCMGSGHILVYMFDVLMTIYRSEGFSEREAVFDILEKNIRGLDIDRRAYQLSYFALMMKARGYNRIFFRGHEDIDGNRIQAVPRVYAIEESNSIERNQLQYYGTSFDELQKNNAINQMSGLLDTLHNAKEYGSILNVENYDWELLHSFVDAFNNSGQISLDGFVAGRLQTLLKKLVDVGEILARKYDAVVTNPPYMSSANMGKKLFEKVEKDYPYSKNDLFAVFIERALMMCRSTGFVSLITQQVWMFITTYKKLREILLNYNLINMNHLGARGFDEISGEVVQTTAFAFRNRYLEGYKSCFIRNTSGMSEAEKEKDFYTDGKKYYINVDKVRNIPENPYIYWMGDALIDVFKNGLLADSQYPKTGVTTGDNDKYLRLWFEVLRSKLSKKWFPLNKGGSYRKWYGNNEYVINWENNGRDIKNEDGSTIRNEEYYFKPGVTWGKICSGTFSARFSSKDRMFDAVGLTCFPNANTSLQYLLGFMCSNVADVYVKMLNPSLSYTVGTIANLPFVYCKEYEDEIVNIVNDCIEISKTDYDLKETSIDYQCHPFVAIIEKNKDSFDVENGIVLAEVFRIWKEECDERFELLKKLEERINGIFIKIYGLGNNLDPHVADKDISVSKAERGRDIRSFISYVVGCMFGRYSIVERGLICAGEPFDEGRYGCFQADKDAIIPVTDEQYFDDDIVGRFEEFIKTVFGSKSLESNLEYIAEVLGTKGNSSRDKIRTYFLNDFYKDHCNTYSVTGSGKRPIYWLFDSGKQNGFKCLIYLHRYTPDTVGLIRSEYLTKVQSVIENALKNAEYAINTSGSAVDRAQATKKRDKYIKQLAEIRAYYPALSHVALQKIELNLDDGVKANYEKFQNIEVSIEGEKKQSIDLLAKI